MSARVGNAKADFQQARVNDLDNLIAKVVEGCGTSGELALVGALLERHRDVIIDRLAKSGLMWVRH